MQSKHKNSKFGEERSRNKPQKASFYALFRVSQTPKNILMERRLALLS